MSAKGESSFSGKKLIVLASFLGIFIFGNVKAQEIVPQQVQSQVNYESQPPIDMDLDGLTDQSELQAYKTDPKNPDTDGDGYYDGAEVLAATDPLDAASIPGMPPAPQGDLMSQNETPWAWYVSRVSGLVAFALLYISIFLGLTIHLPFLRTIFAPVYAMNAHGWIALQATIFALIHGLVLTLDKFLSFSLISILVPFASEYERILVAMGTIGFYLMVLLVATSYLRKYMSFKVWRAIHFFNVELYLVVVFHAFFLGTDLKNEMVRNIFVYANIFLILIMLINMFIRIRKNIIRKNAVNRGDISAPSMGDDTKDSSSENNMIQ